MTRDFNSRDDSFANSFKRQTENRQEIATEYCIKCTVTSKPKMFKLGVIAFVCGARLLLVVDTLARKVIKCNSHFC